MYVLISIRKRPTLIDMKCSTGKDELLETAMALHDVAMKDEYFIKRKLAPNVDFWCVFHFILIHYCHYLITLIGGTCFSPQ